MFTKIAGLSIVLAVAMFFSITSLQAGNFDRQAKIDRLTLQKYMLKKFKDPVKNRGEFFPYISSKELKKQYYKNLKLQDFAHGSYAINKRDRAQYNQINEIPPYDFDMADGKKLYNTPFKNGKSFKNCFPKLNIMDRYPYFDTKRNEVITIGQAINECRKNNGEKLWKWGKGKIAKLESFFAYNSRGETIDVRIQSLAAKKAYEAGKKFYFSRRGYLGVSCANCHIQNSGMRTRMQTLSPLLGVYAHFPSYRLKWQGLGTIQRRFKGCVKNTGSVPPKMQSKIFKELEYFVAYMSNGIKLIGPDLGR